MMVAGIDWSMTCPSITIGNSKDFSKCKSFYYINDKNKVLQYQSSIYGMMMLPYESEEERFDNLSEWALSILKKFKVTHVCLEGYSMGSKGRVFAIAENAGLLKHKLWKANISVVSPAPTQVKKYFTDKGNANKEIMHDAFVEKTGVDISKIIDPKKPNKTSNPVSDIVDSYAMLCYGIDNCF